MATQHNRANGLDHAVVARKMVTVLASQLRWISRQEWNGYVRAKSKGGHGWDQDCEPFPCLSVPVRAVPLPCPHESR
jgi:hypothetical protein